MTKIYFDCEYNGFLGDLISIALVSECDNRFYGALHCEEPTEWISKNVIPVLNFPPLSIKTLQHRLCEYINQFSEVIFICDWPEDVMHLSKLLLVGGGQMLDIKPKMTFVIDSKLNSFGSVIPHNALEDALAIKRMA